MSLFNKYFKDHQLQIILTNYDFKDKLTKGTTACAVNNYWSCSNCGAHYIGSSSRNLYIRAAEHSSVSMEVELLWRRPNAPSVAQPWGFASLTFGRVCQI